MMIAETGQIRNQRCGLAIFRDAENSSALEFASFSNKEIAIVESHTSPWPIAFAGGDFGKPSAILDPQQARFRPYFSVGVTRLDHARSVLLIERDSGRKREAAGHRFDVKTCGYGNRVSVNLAVT